MPQQCLNGTNIGAALQQMRGETVAEGMGGNPFGNTCLYKTPTHSSHDFEWRPLRHPVKLDELLDPIAIGALGVQGIMFQAHDTANVVQQGW